MPLAIFYFTSYVLKMFRTLIYPSLGACDCVDELPHRLSCTEFVACWSFGAASFRWYSFQAEALITNTTQNRPH